MTSGYSFRPRLWALALAAAACAAGIALGNWQSGRAEEKRALGAGLARVAVEGEFVPRYTVYLDSKVRRGTVGYEIVTPLRLRDSPAHVLVKRGWVAAGKTREHVPEVRTPTGPVRLEGLALPRIERLLVVGPQTGRVRQNLDTAAYAKETGLPLEPRVIEQHSDTGDGLVRDWPPHDAGFEKHQGYALQWYSLAALAVVLALVFSFRNNEAAAK
jgi:surfeit locus 1 family protein